MLIYIVPLAKMDAIIKVKGVKVMAPLAAMATAVDDGTDADADVVDADIAKKTKKSVKTKVKAEPKKPARKQAAKVVMNSMNALTALTASNALTALNSQGEFADAVDEANALDAVDAVDAVDVASIAKRGRKPKAVYSSFEMLPCSSDDEHIIMKLNVGPDCGDDGLHNSNVPGPYNEIINSMNYSQLDQLDQVPTVEQAEEKLVKAQSHLKVIELLKDFEEKNKNDEWPQSTSIHCYWCCHKFDGAPFGIPLKYVNGKFHVYGCFCSLECASAYNFDSKDSHDEIWERNNLLNFIAQKIEYGRRIKPAPTRLSLYMFGGHLSIKDFRDYCNTSKLININFPPMMTLTQQIEEINESDISNEFKYIPVDTDRINKYKEKIYLKRSKPINALENTLDHAMNLKFGDTV